jgi:hypothetical protein
MSVSTLCASIWVTAYFPAFPGPTDKAMTKARIGIRMCFLLQVDEMAIVDIFVYAGKLSVPVASRMTSC